MFIKSTLAVLAYAAVAASESAASNESTVANARRTVRKRAVGDTLIVQGNVNTDIGVIFETDFTAGMWHNFGLVMDFDANTTQVLYSTNAIPLVAITRVLANEINGEGQYHFGLLKKPTGDNLTDITKQGYQPANIDEGVIYGGMFVADGADGCVDLSP